MVSVASVAVLVAYIVMVAFNGLANTDLFGGTDQGTISNENPTYLTPDGLTFAVWGLIYLFQAVLVLYQLRPSEEAEAILESKMMGVSVRWRLVLAFLLNAAWLPVFNNELFWPALVIIAAYLVALLWVYYDLNPKNTKGFLQALLLTYGISSNLAWLVVATCLNAFFCLGTAGWKDEYGVAGTPLAAIIVGVFVACFAMERVVQGADWIYAFVAGWALQGIYRMQSVVDAERFPPEAMNSTLANTALVLSVVVWVLSLIGLVMALFVSSDSLLSAIKSRAASTSKAEEPAKQLPEEQAAPAEVEAQVS
eukprot:TRINITY_DN3446_c0_g1_i1.p1 TRINITY_DN3446_c0_g1~~TRINITY_DN3446_c0_g1_i1.p1  ORF type:complete len:309 (-),score=69.52 TRINITY_DN3446_c0_g1_i1:390-1316(-)